MFGDPVASRTRTLLETRPRREAVPRFLPRPFPPAWPSRYKTAKLMVTVAVFRLKRSFIWGAPSKWGRSVAAFEDYGRREEEEKDKITQIKKILLTLF